MAKDKLRARIFNKALDHLMRPAPIVMVSCQPSLRYIVFVVLMDVILVCGEEPRSTLG